MKNLKFIIAVTTILVAFNAIEVTSAAPKTISCEQTFSKKLDIRIEHRQDQMLARNAAARKKYESTGKVGESIKLVTFNAGLLNKLFRLAYVPEYQRRSPEILNSLDIYLRQERPTIVTLQEIWHLKDVESIERVAKFNGYTSFVAEKTKNTNPFGLMILTDSRRMSKETPARVHRPIAAPRLATEKLAGLKKGFFATNITMTNGTRILAINGHFTYSSKGTEARLLQLERLSDFIKDQKEHYDYVVLGIDTNSSDRFPKKIDGKDFDEVATGWYRDKEVYLNTALLNHEIEFTDVFKATEATAPFTQDPTKNAIARHGSTTKDEPPQRLDYIWIGRNPSSNNDFYVSEPSLVFEKALTNLDGSAKLASEYSSNDGTSGGELFLSDHSGVTANAMLFRLDN